MKRHEKSYDQQMVDLFREYEMAHPNEVVIDSANVYRWAKLNRLWFPHIEDEARIFKRQLGKALRKEKRVDASGRPHRARLSVRLTKNGKQYTLWGDIETFPRRYVEKSIAQRRKQIEGDCFGLQMDVDHYNEYHPKQEPIQTYLDFRDDVEEKKLETMQRQRGAA